MVALIGVMMTSWAEPAEKSDDSTTVYVNDSVSLLIMYSDLLAFIPITHTHTHTHAHAHEHVHAHAHAHTHTHTSHYASATSSEERESSLLDW